MKGILPLPSYSWRWKGKHGIELGLAKRSSVNRLVQIMDMNEENNSLLRHILLYSILLQHNSYKRKENTNAQKRHGYDINFETERRMCISLYIEPQRHNANKWIIVNRISSSPRISPPTSHSVYGLHSYVRPQRVWFFNRFGNKWGIDLSWFWPFWSWIGYGLCTVTLIWVSF